MNIPEVNETVLTLKKSCPFSAHLILLGLISQAISLPLVPFGTLTSMKTSSIVCAHEPHGVLDGTTPLLSSKWSAILNYWGIPLSGKYYRLVIFSKPPLVVVILLSLSQMRLGARVCWLPQSGFCRFLPRFINQFTSGPSFCKAGVEMSVSGWMTIVKRL